MLVISPHFKLFLREQITSIASFFQKLTVMVPRPYFPSFLLNVPYINNKFPFLRSITESCKKERLEKIDITFPKFFAFPLSIMRDRTLISCGHSISRMLKRNKIEFDIIHAHRLDIGFSGALLKDHWGKPLIITSHGSDVYEFPFRNNFTYAIVRYTLQRADHVIAVCRSDANKILSLGLNPRKLSLIPNGFNESLFSPLPQRYARTKLGLLINKKILLSVGTLHEVKGHIYLIRAMYRISKIRNDVIAVIIGSGPLEKKLRKEITKLGLDESVILMGWEPHNRIPLWINASDIFVLPSLNEGHPTVIAEALGCGKPIIATKVGGIPETVINEEIGLLIDPADTQALTQAINEALNKKWSTEKILEHAKNYSLSTITKRLFEIYKHYLHD
ncbi:MAG: glycosyltransferase [Nitrososphaerota archaeon]